MNKKTSLKNWCNTPVDVSKLLNKKLAALLVGSFILLVFVVSYIVGLTSNGAHRFDYATIEPVNAECKQTIKMHILEKQTLTNTGIAQILPYGEIEVHLTYSGGYEDFVRVKKGYMFHAVYKMDKHGRIVDQYIFIQDETPDDKGLIDVCFWEIGGV